MEIIFYIGIFLFIIGAWQAFMQGTHSEVISGISLILGTIFVLIGDWHAGLFFIFLFSSWFLLMQIFRFSTYHRYFFKILVFLIGYAVLVGFLLNKLGFQNYLWWYLILSFLFLTVSHREQWKSKKMLNEFVQMKSYTQELKPKEIEWSLNQTIKFHLISSALFVATFLVSALYFAGKINF
ncbi:MAG: hypothetical protein PHO48_03630 [Candidatus Gracilibacteria bacterium]|nr:hypothetical protein [Candidatus Gracilibacteria bacterium]